MPKSLESKIESLLFVSGKPLGIRKLAEVCQATQDEVREGIKALRERFEKEGSGLMIIQTKDSVSLGTATGNTGLIQSFLKDELTGELTRPALETLTIIAYRGPITKPEIEQIRGINCSLILRNLLLRGLIEVDDKGGRAQPVYSITLDFLRYLGVSSVEELPDYGKLSAPDLLEKLSS